MHPVSSLPPSLSHVLPPQLSVPFPESRLLTLFHELLDSIRVICMTTGLRSFAVVGVGTSGYSIFPFLQPIQKLMLRTEV